VTRPPRLFPIPRPPFFFRSMRVRMDFDHR
jgi:hypothetical protein